MDGTAILKKPENCTPRFIRQSMRHGRQQQLSYDVSLIKLTTTTTTTTTTTSTSAANPDITAGLLRHPPP
jgi:hypothetical protein